MNLFDTMMTSAFSEFQRVMPTYADVYYYGDTTHSGTITGVMQVTNKEKSYDNHQLDVTVASFLVKQGDLDPVKIGTGFEIDNERWIVQGHSNIAGGIVSYTIELADRKTVGTVRGAGKQQ